MTNQDKFKLVAEALSQGFIANNPKYKYHFTCNRRSSECRTCILNGSNYDEYGICFGAQTLNSYSLLASEFFDQYPEFSI